MTWKYYKCSHCPFYHFKPAKDDTSEFETHIKNEHDIDDIKLSNYVVKNIHPLNGSDDITSRGKFWDNIKEEALDPDNLDYEGDEGDEANVNIENKKKLMDTDSFEYLWEHYFIHKITPRKKIENLIGIITIELLIILVKIYREDMDVDKFLTKEELPGEKVEYEGKEEEVDEVEVGEEDKVEEESEEEEVEVGEEDKVEVGEEDKVEEESEEEEVEVGEEDKVEEESEEEEVEVEEVEVGEEDKVEEEGEEEIKLNIIYNLDCCEYLKKLTDKSIDSIILDPPYYEVVKEDWDNQWTTFMDYLEWFKPIIKELNRVSKYSCSCFVFGFPEQLSYLLPLFENEGFKYRQHICVSKGLSSVAGRTSHKLKMFPTASEYILYFYKDATTIIKTMLQQKQKEHKLTGSDINNYLGKASNGGGTWSTIAGEKQQNIQNPTREDWNKLEALFGGFDIKYDDYVYKFNLPTGLTDVWTDINFNDRKYKKLWNKKYEEKCSHPTMKPYNLIKRLIECSTDEGDIVLDIFMGTGMTGLVCKDIGRRFMACELDPKFVERSLIHIT